MLGLLFIRVLIRYIYSITQHKHKLRQFILIPLAINGNYNSAVFSFISCVSFSWDAEGSQVEIIKMKGLHQWMGKGLHSVPTALYTQSHSINQMHNVVFMYCRLWRRIELFKISRSIISQFEEKPGNLQPQNEFFDWWNEWNDENNMYMYVGICIYKLILKEKETKRK